MKKISIVLIAMLCMFLSWGQTIKVTETGKSERTFPTKYAIVLYADQVTEKSGKNKLLAAHWQNTGGGRFTWQKNIAAEGDYEIVMNYAAAKPGIEATISSGNSKQLITALKVTLGYYPEKKGWADINFERKSIPGKLYLDKGLNTISLELKTQSSSDEIFLYSVELIPVSKLPAIQKDWLQAEKMRANTDWFAQIPYGVMFHWTSQSMPEQGPKKPYNEAVNDFDVSAFVKMVAKAGAGYVILTTNHAEPYFPAPLKEWEKVYPGHTAQRDLIDEIADSLVKYNIKLFLYMATHVYAKLDSANDEEFTRLNHVLIREVGERYKKKVAGYWLDGWYQSFQKHPSFDFEKFNAICKAGNPERLVCLNTWLYPANTMWQDYWPGEVYIIGSPATHKTSTNGPGKGLQLQNLIVMETEDWLHQTLNTKIPSPHLKADDLIKFIAQSRGKGPVTINMQIYQHGRVGEEALQVMEAVKKSIHK